ncbi:MAG: hypothetical protein ACI9BW_003001, partial [Gammaproteobacteria bacterium]
MIHTAVGKTTMNDVLRQHRDTGVLVLTRLRAQTINYRGQPVEAVFIPGMRDCRHVFDA